MNIEIGDMQLAMRYLLNDPDGVSFKHICIDEEDLRRVEHENRDAGDRFKFLLTVCRYLWSPPPPPIDEQVEILVNQVRLARQAYEQEKMKAEKAFKEQQTAEDSLVVACESRDENANEIYFLKLDIRKLKTRLRRISKDKERNASSSLAAKDREMEAYLL